MSYPSSNRDWPGVRASGRTTRLALHYVLMLLDNPDEPVYISDHADTRHADKHLFKLVAQLLSVLGIQHTGNIAECRITIPPPPRDYEYPSINECVTRYQEFTNQYRGQRPLG